ncbi:MAG: AfsR/SARP family transcriptional regulator [Natronosporangium sp.]
MTVPGIAGTVRFELLGPLRVQVDGRQVPIGSTRARTVLAMLLLRAGRTVSVDQLSEAVWADDPPDTVRNQIHTSVSRLRQRLPGPEPTIVTEPSGYRLQVDPDQADAHRFRALVAEAREAVARGREGDARKSYRAALELWRGPALSDLDSNLVREQAGTLDAEREQALEECLEVELALGGAGELVPELTALVGQYPYRERLHAALMRALYRAGRPADALAAFRSARQRFHDELGTEPGEQLQVLHQAILNNEPDLGVAPPVAARAPGPIHDLPAEPGRFVGRAAELGSVRNLLVPPDRAARRRPPVVVLYGPGGTGKSALAVRVAHELADQFPDGQLYVDLCGSTPGMRAVPPVEVLGRFLRRLGVHPSEVPSEAAEAAALFRGLTADRRLLLVLDNAVDRSQLAGLLPGTPNCAVLVTSRHPLPTLDADGRLRVEALPEADALALLALLTGRQSAEPEAAKEIVSLCGGLPLALRVAAGRLAARPDLTTAEYARRLADRSRRLDELQLDDLAVRASIRTSYDALLADGDPAGHRAARAFRMLGLLQVPDVAPPVVTAMLTEPDTETARTALDRLVDAQLVEPVAGGRYRLHDLVRLVAAERAHEEESEPDRDDSVYRAIAFYTGALWRAEKRSRHSRVTPFGEPPLPDHVQLPEFGEVSKAGSWIDAELANLEAAVAQAVGAPGRADRYTLWLSDALWLNLDTRCDWQAALRVSCVTARGAERRGDREIAALGLLLQGRSEACLGSYDAAAAYLVRALDAMRELRNRAGIALTLNGLGRVHALRGEPGAALLRYGEALELATALELASLAAGVLSNMVVSYAELGQLDCAVAVGERSVAICTADEDSRTHAVATINLAAALSLRGDQVRALRCADRALALSQDAGDRMRMCEELLIRSGANLRSGRLRAAHVDAERARVLAAASRYTYAAAAAEKQLSNILTAMGRVGEAAHARARAQDTLARLTLAFWDPTIELLLA